MESSHLMLPEYLMGWAHPLEGSQRPESNGIKREEALGISTGQD